MNYDWEFWFVVATLGATAAALLRWLDRAGDDWLFGGDLLAGDDGAAAAFSDRVRDRAA